MNDLSDECLLAAIQVQVTYLIMRLVDGAAQPDKLDVQLLLTFKVGFWLNYCCIQPGAS